MNSSNLRPTSVMSSEERAAISKRGGKASGVARKQKKNLRAALCALLSGKMQDPNGKLTGAEVLALSVFEKAKAGNVRAVQFIAEITGEYRPGIAIEDTTPKRRQLTPAEAAEILAELEKRI